MKYTQIPADTFEQLVLNAGIIAKTFAPATGTVSDIVGATSGGIAFEATPTFKDFGEDIDNCPKNTKELKRLDDWEVKMSGTFVTVTASTAKMMTALADVDNDDTTKVVPRSTLDIENDFETLWFIGDYSDKNTGSTAGFLAIKLMNALSTGGFKLQTGDKEKGQFAFEFTGHYSLNAQDTVPFEVYVKEGTATTEPRIYLNQHTVTVAKNGTTSLVATVVPSNATVTWTSGSAVASVSNGTVTAGANAGNTIITASITVDGVTYNDTCTVIVTA